MHNESSNIEEAREKIKGFLRVYTANSPFAVLPFPCGTRVTIKKDQTGHLVAIHHPEKSFVVHSTERAEGSDYTVVTSHPNPVDFTLRGSGNLQGADKVPQELLEHLERLTLCPPWETVSSC